jgi:nitroreductase
MEIDWEKAIRIRRSVRSYEMNRVEKVETDLLDHFIDSLKVPFEHHVRIQRFQARPDKKLYFAFDSPPDNLAFLADTDVCSISAAGFVGELVILYATSLGLATCWYGHYDLAELERLMPHLGSFRESTRSRWGYGKGFVEGERAICVTPLGYWKQGGMRLVDRMQESLISHRRKPAEDLLEGGLTDRELSPELSYALDLARKAPSAANSQHWRFAVGSGGKEISIAMPVGYKHIKWEHPDVDIGICASHFWLGLVMKNINCKVSISEEQGRAVWRFVIAIN